ncbi:MULTISPECIES: hypothetical protein [unclassified Carboxylicivirga]|uniref:hypothetical protein n=1 Tax=Carboxylicivirga TaxID=1628153 RepID=UPI003D3287C1
MKRFLKYAFGLLLVSCLVIACDDSDDNAISGFSIDTSELTLGAEGGTQVIKVSSGSKWVVRVNQPWIKVVPSNGFGNVECDVVVDTSLSNEIREAQITFLPANQPVQDVAVHQTGFGKMIGLSTQQVEVANMGKYGKRYFEIDVTTNVDFKVEIPYESQSWIKLEKQPDVTLDYGARPQTTKVRFNWEMNTEPQAREVAINFVPVYEEDVLEQEVVLNVMQEAAPLIEDNRAGDSLALIIIKEKLNGMVSWDMTDKIDFWDGISVWEKTDEGVSPEMVGRVRRLDMRLINTKEGLPMELGKLRYLESLVIYGNANRHILPDRLMMGPALAELEYLKHLTIGSYGITDINPNLELTKPKATLESLNLTANNFTSLPYSISNYNFPKLIALNLGGMRRYDTKKDLRDDVWQANWGMRIPASQITRLFEWEKLEYLHLSYGYIYGELPDMKGWNAKYYTAEQIAANDTLNSASEANKQRLMTEIPRVLPNIKELALNLNFLSGNLPDWLLYHPRLNDFLPDMKIFTQENGYDRNGNVPRFDNAPENMEYFYEFYPAARPEYLE